MARPFRSKTVDRRSKTLAYLRVSTEAQDLANQRLAIHDFAHRHGITLDGFVEFQISSRKSTQERGLDQLLEQLQSGDTLIVSELSRLGRSLGQIIQFVEGLLQQRVRFIAIKENIRLGDEQDMQTKVMVAMFGLFAEIERDLISKRTKEGLATAKAKGRLVGRPKGSLGKSKLDGKEKEIQTLLTKTVSQASIAKIIGVSPTTLQHFIRSRRLI